MMHLQTKYPVIRVRKARRKRPNRPGADTSDDTATVVVFPSLAAEELIQGTLVNGQTLGTVSTVAPAESAISAPHVLAIHKKTKEPRSVYAVISTPPARDAS